MLKTAKAIKNNFRLATEAEDNSVNALLSELDQSRMGRIIKRWIDGHNINIKPYNGDHGDEGFTYAGGYHTKTKTVYLNEKTLSRPEKSLENLMTLVHELRHAWQVEKLGTVEEDTATNPSAMLVLTRMVEADAYSFESVFGYYHCRERGYDVNGFFEKPKDIAGFVEQVENDLAMGCDDPYKMVVSRRRLLDGYFQYPDHSYIEDYDLNEVDHIINIAELLKEQFDPGPEDNQANREELLKKRSEFMRQAIPTLQAERLAVVGEAVGFDVPSPNMFDCDEEKHGLYTGKYGVNLQQGFLDMIKNVFSPAPQSLAAFEFNARSFCPPTNKDKKIPGNVFQPFYQNFPPAFPKTRQNAAGI